MAALLSDDCELHLEGTARLAGRSEPYRGHEGMREYLTDVERLWEELELHADDFRAVPGSVIVMGHVTGRRQGLAVRRSSVWTWRVKAGRARSVKAADLGDRPWRRGGGARPAARHVDHQAPQPRARTARAARAGG